MEIVQLHTAHRGFKGERLEVGAKLVYYPKN